MHVDSGMENGRMEMDGFRVDGKSRSDQIIGLVTARWPPL